MYKCTDYNEHLLINTLSLAAINICTKHNYLLLK